MVDMTVLALLVLFGWCAALSVADLRWRRLPNPLTLGGVVVILGYALAHGQGTAAAAGALLLAGPYLVVHLAAPAACGAGDVKLAVGLGAAAACGSAGAWVWAALAAPVLTALLGVVAILVRTCRIRAAPGPRPLPHGPSMCLSTLVALLVAR